MEWHLTWQDPIAIALAVLGLVFVWWLRRRFEGESNCAECTSKPTPKSKTATPLASLRLGKPRTEPTAPS